MLQGSNVGPRTPKYLIIVTVAGLAIKIILITSIVIAQTQLIQTVKDAENYI